MIPLPLFYILRMPQKVSESARIFKPGAKPFEFFDADRMSRRLPIFFNIERKKETVQWKYPLEVQGFQGFLALRRTVTA